MNYDDWISFRSGAKPAFRHFTFKLGVLLYAIRLLGMEQEVGAQLRMMKQRLWDAQTENGGVAHFIDVHKDGRFTRGDGATGEATAIAILSETVERSRGTSEAQNHRQPRSPFAQRGYYITFMRMPTYDLADWKKIVDGIHDDGGNTLLLWIGGAFRSKKYPITWRYNQEHENVRNDFVRGPDRPRPRQGHQGTPGLHAVRLRRRESVSAGAPRDEGRRQGWSAGRQGGHRLLGL